MKNSNSKVKTLFMATSKLSRVRREKQILVKEIYKKKRTKSTQPKVSKKKESKKSVSSSSEDAPFPSLSPSVLDAVNLAAWSENTLTRDWVPQRTNKVTSSSVPDIPCDRLDIVGTSNVNELVLRHGTMPTSELRTSQHPTLFKRASQHSALANLRQQPSLSPNPQFMLERYLSNLVRALVHPLHNFLQCHHGLHNADEVQVMLMPRDGPIAAADRAAKPSRASSALHSESSSNTTSDLRRCYVATNNETLTEDYLQRAVRGWGVAGVFQISEFVLVRGEKGRHAEQKLLDYLRTCILSPDLVSLHPTVLTAERKALVVGERLPCVSCRLFAVLYEDVAVLLPSHGHMYISTIGPSLAALESSSPITEKGKKAIRNAFASPAVAAKMLLSSAHQRVLR